MRRLLMLLIFGWSVSFGGPVYDHYFLQSTMRVDYFHTGTKGEETFSLDEIYQEGEWPGSKVNLIDTLNLGEYMLRVFDRATNVMIYSRGYSTMFNEWQTTDEALKGVHRTFAETARLPWPKREVQLSLLRRDRAMVFHEVFTTIIDPNDPVQINRTTMGKKYDVQKLMNNGSPSGKVDLVILGDGYAAADMEKFRADAKHFNDVMFGTQPFKDRRNDFNVWTVEVVSGETGIDIPDKNVWRENALGSRYNTFGSARYVLTTENRELRNAAGEVPYDFILILINDSRYGGGGIYNLYTTTYTVENNKSQEWQRDYVYVHEFGHSFGGLGDEYYSSSTAYNDFYSPGVEPWEPNITALINPHQVKWGSQVSDGTPIPTPWDKAAYDSLEALRGKLDRLAPDYYEKREPLYRAEMAILKNAKYKDEVGAFEGAGYAAKGLYRPAVDCRMFSLSLVDFDPVCAAAIERQINFYTK